MQNEALLTHFIEQAPTAMAMFDRQMRYLASSLRWRQDYGLEGNLLGRSHYEVLPEIGEARRIIHRRALAGETLSGDRDAFVRADGSVQWLRWQVQAWRRANGEIGGLVLFSEDISNSEREQEKTRQSDAALRALGDNLPDTTIYRYKRDKDGIAHFLYISAGLEKTSGVRPEAAMANSSLLFSQVLPEYAPAVFEAETVSRRDFTDLDVQTPIRRPDGELRWVRLRARPYRQTDGEIIWNGVQIDITAEKRQEAARREIELRKSYLLDMADALKPLGDPVQIIAVASERLGRHLGAHQVVYAEIDDKEEFATIRHEWSDQSMPTSVGVHRLVDFGPELIAGLRLGRVYVVENIATDPRAAPESVQAAFRGLMIGAFLSVPLVKAGKLVAILSVHQHDPRAWGALDIALAEETAERTWAATERAGVQEALREGEERLRFALSAANAAAFEWNPVTNALVWSDELYRLYGLEPRSVEPSIEVFLQTIHPGDRASVVASMQRAVEERRELTNEWRVCDPDGVVRWLLGRGGPVYRIGDPKPRYIGVVFDITERKRSEEKIRYLAHHDVQTGLPNRLAFNDLLTAEFANADATQTSVAVLCVDLDRFKEVNDVFGHVVGDELLRQLSKRFLVALEGTEVARVGGDEFMVIVSGSPIAARAKDTAERLRGAVAAPFEVGGRQMRIGLSIGVAVYPDHGDTEKVLACADAALYRAKAEGRARVCFFNSSLDNRLREQRALLQDLKSAIANRELLLHYQPQANIEGAVFGFEALARWRHPRRGLVPPGLFIPIAEENGLIAEIGEWVLREACREAASWPRPMNVAVNLSPVQFLEDGLPALVHSVLLETGLPGHRLELEITEGVLAKDFSRVSSILRQLKSLGVKVAMDDFGTGYSSLSYVQSFPFDKIKIDRSFVSSLQDNANSQAIVRAIIGLGHGLQLPLIAEGVETEEQLGFLRSAGCDEAQGYLIGAPRAIEDYAGLVGRAPAKQRAQLSA